MFFASLFALTMSVSRKAVSNLRFVGGPGYVGQDYLDGMAIHRVFGPPDLVATFVCNLKWQEIIYGFRSDSVHSHAYRLGIVCRVFYKKHFEFLEGFKEGFPFGKIKVCMFSCLLCLSPLTYVLQGIVFAFAICVLFLEFFPLCLTFLFFFPV